MDSNLFFSFERRKKGFEDSPDFRTPFERDFDRILFSAPVRRLADKTQVFPLEKNDSIRTRLTHSYEVSNLARSIGNALVADGEFNELLIENKARNLPALLAATGLVHDLGNPPFGHQGETAIKAWFIRNQKKIFEGSSLTVAQKNDFLNFEGNAQTFRLITKLQILNDYYGLDLTVATLAACIKYPIASDEIIEGNALKKKNGYFQSEKETYDDILKKTGLGRGMRHPMTFIMEACDDIAYSILDAEDAVKKNLVSFNDLISYLESGNSDEKIEKVLKDPKNKYIEYQKAGLSPKELNDVSMQRLRVSVIGVMVESVINTFKQNKHDIFNGKFLHDLISISDVNNLAKKLKKFDYLNAYRAPSVLELELSGFNTINEIMDLLWIGITKRKNEDDLKSERSTPFAKYAYGLISENYRRIFEDTNNLMPPRYKEAQLLTDMISGMSDQYAVDFHYHLKKFYNENYS